MPGGLSPECDSALRDGISPPFHWHTVKSVPGIAAKTLHQGQNMTLSTLDFYLSHTRPAVVFLSGALCSLLLAGICFCTAKYERPARKVLVRTVRQPEAWVATVLAQQAHHLKGRQQQWRMRQTKQVQNLHFDKNEWTTAVKYILNVALETKPSADGASGAVLLRRISIVLVAVLLGQDPTFTRRLVKPC